jgi:hypothetical protein
MRLAFVACVEPGRLEAQGVLLFESIRRFAGRFADSPILSFQPRDPGPLQRVTRHALRRLGVEHHVERLNREFEHVPAANKLFATAWAEANLDVDVVVFVDSDTFFCGEPDELALEADRVAGLRPANKKNVASTGPDDRKDGYWQKVYALCGVPEPPFVETTVDRVRVRAYWNAGLMAFRRSEGLSERWLACFRTLLEADHLPYNGVKNADQVALAAALAPVAERVVILDPRYNYPLPKRALLPEPWCRAELEALRHVHYFRWFNKPGYLDEIEPPLAADSELRAWLAERLPLTPLVTDPGRKTEVAVSLPAK